MKSSGFLSWVMMLTLSLPVSVAAQAGDWDYLGAAKVHGRLDHDVIYVTRLRGDFTAIKLFVENEGIDFDRVVVHFANGGKEEMIIRNFVPAGGETRALDLRGASRIIERVDFYYKSNPLSRRKAKVVLYGRR